MRHQSNSAADTVAVAIGDDRGDGGTPKAGDWFAVCAERDIGGWTGVDCDTHGTRLVRTGRRCGDIDVSSGAAGGVGRGVGAVAIVCCGTDGSRSD